MFLENLGIDATDPIRLGRFWEAALGTTTLTVGLDIFETRLDLDDGAYLDLCFALVPEPPTSPQRLHLDLRGGAQQQEVAARLQDFGARDLDIGQGEVPWIVLADVEGGAFCVMEEREEFVATGPIAALPLDSADPERDADFWAWLTGWVDVDGQAPRALRHPSLSGPLLSLYPEPAAKLPDAKNPIHLDVRLEAGDDADEVAAQIAERGRPRAPPRRGRPALAGVPGSLRQRVLRAAGARGGGMSGGRRTAGFLAVLLGGAGVLHLVRPEHFDRIVPPALPGSARAYTYASGVAELGVAGLLAVPRTRRLGGVAGVALFVAVFPANLQMAYDWRGAGPRKRAVALGRLPLQGVLIAQARHVAVAEARG